MLNEEFDDYDTQDQIEEHDLDRDDDEVFNDDDADFLDDSDDGPENGSGGYRDWDNEDYTRYEFNDIPDDEFEDDFEEDEGE